jgi:hypothetical protein
MRLYWKNLSFLVLFSGPVFGCAFGAVQDSLACRPSAINVALQFRTSMAEAKAMLVANAALETLGYHVSPRGYESDRFDCFLRLERVDASNVRFARYYGRDDPEEFMETLRELLSSLLSETDVGGEVRIAEEIKLH